MRDLACAVLMPGLRVVDPQRLGEMRGLRGDHWAEFVPLAQGKLTGQEAFYQWKPYLPTRLRLKPGDLAVLK